MSGFPGFIGHGLASAGEPVVVRRGVPARSRRAFRRVVERVVVADQHVARGVAELRRDELRIAAADERARDVAATQCLLGVTLARAHLRAIEHPLPIRAASS
jgi:hypothetical protein